MGNIGTHFKIDFSILSELIWEGHRQIELTVSGLKKIKCNYLEREEMA